MNDEKIIELYWQREDSAIAETEKKYGKYCHKIAWNILLDDLDAEETVSYDDFTSHNVFFDGGNG